MNTTLTIVYLILLGAMSFITFTVFAIDKKSSHNESNGRIPEIVLLSLTSFGGSIGAMLGMYGLRHKTNFKTKYHFALTAWISLIVQIGLAVLMLLNRA